MHDTDFLKISNAKGKDPDVFDLFEQILKVQEIAQCGENDVLAAKEGAVYPGMQRLSAAGARGTQKNNVHRDVTRIWSAATKMPKPFRLEADQKAEGPHIFTE